MEGTRILVFWGGLSGLAAAKALAAVSPVLGAGSTFDGCGKSILNESSAAEEFGEESESLGDKPWRLALAELEQNLWAGLIRRCIIHDFHDFLTSVQDTEWGKKNSAAGNKMTVETSSKGGFDIEIGSYTVHVPKYSSVHHPLAQMVLFARTMYDSTFRCLKYVGHKSMVKFKESGLLITKTKSEPPNTVSARKDVHVPADTAPENHSITPRMDKKIPKLGELDYNVDLSTVPVHSGGFALESTYNLHSLTSAPNSADHITKAEDKAEVWRLANIAKAEDNTEDWGFKNIAKAEDKTKDWLWANVAKAEDKTEVTWLMATAAVHHATGIRDLLSGFTTIKDLFVKAGDGVSMPVCGRGSVITGMVVLEDVWFVPGLTENLVSVTQLTDLDYSVGFARTTCIIKNTTDGVVIGKADASEDGLFKVKFLNVLAGE